MIQWCVLAAHEFAAQMHASRAMQENVTKSARKVVRLQSLLKEVKSQVCAPPPLLPSLPPGGTYLCA